MSASKRIAVSTCALPGLSMADVERKAVANDWLIEFSSGFKYEENLETKFIQAKCRKLLHNYFPQPATPFVLNLASTEPTIWEASLEHVRKALRLAKEASVPFYSVHAGYGVDPAPKDLGKPFQKEVSQPREKYWNVFIKAIKMLLSDADQLGVDLYVENNVMIAENRQVPLLCVTPEETKKLIRGAAHPRLGILLDTGHAKVSGKTLAFNPADFVTQLGSSIKAIHHNDNDGLRDTNLTLGNDYWFLRHMPAFSESWHVIEVNRLTDDQIHQQVALLQNAAAVAS